MKRQLWYASCGFVALLGVNAAFLSLHQSTSPVLGSVADWNELSEIRGEAIPLTYCALKGGNCTAGAVAGCGDPDAFQACASEGTICNTCAAANEQCEYGGVLTCFMKAGGTTCCAPPLCIYVAPVIGDGNPNGTCGCGAPGVAAGSRTDC